VRRLAASTLTVALLLAAACSGGDEDDDAAEPTGSEAVPVLPAGAFDFTGGDVTMGDPIDPLHTCDGNSISPALDWVGVPEGTAELALVVDDPDAPGGTFTHWVVYAIPADYEGLERGVPPGPSVSGAVTLRQGPSDGSDIPGYFGPCPPGGETHDYVFTLYALDEEIGLEGGASLDDLRAAIEGHVIAEASLTAPYSRSSR
jgi:Raf kinase inhibitor-like YbhB/YbcL family protein